MTDLLPCPFCGAEAKNNGHRSCDCCGKAYTGIVSCTKCTAEVSHLDTDAEAIAAWNARAPAQIPANHVPEAMQRELDGCRHAVSTIESNRTGNKTQDRNYAFYQGKVAGLEYALVAMPSEPAQATPEPSAMTERLIQAAVDYEQAGGQHAAAARRELSEARAAIEAALSTVPSANRVCAKCGCETMGEEALVNGVIWCHPCADGCSFSSTDRLTATDDGPKPACNFCGKSVFGPCTSNAMAAGCVLPPAERGGAA